MLLVAQLWFRIPFAGSFITLYAGLSVFLLAAVGMGLLLSSVAATMQQAMLLSFLLIMPFALLSGLTTPVSSMPVFLQYVTLINPLRYAIDIAHRVYLEGVGLGLLVPELWPLAVIALVTLSRRVLDVSPSTRLARGSIIDEKELEVMYMNLIQKWNKAGAVLLLCAAGCAVGPDYERPDLAAPAAWQEGGQRGIDTRTADMAQWWTAFKDPLLDSLVERAVKSNLDLRIAEARVREERALLAATASGLWPTMDVAGSYSRSRGSQNALVFGGGGGGAAFSGGRILEQISFRTVSMPIGKSIYSAAPDGASKPPKRASKRSSKIAAAYW